MECNKRFMRSDHLSKHIRTHQHRKPGELASQDVSTLATENSESMSAVTMDVDHCELTINETSIGIDPCDQVNTEPLAVHPKEEMPSPEPVDAM